MNCHGVYLAGNFNDACLTNSQIDFLQLHAGSFKNFDLADARVKRLALAILDTDLIGLRFPRNLKRVQLNDFYDEEILPAEPTTARASEIIAAWNSPAECDDLARRILRRVKSLSAAMKQQLLNSSGCSPSSSLGGHPQPRGKSRHRSRADHEEKIKCCWNSISPRPCTETSHPFMAAAQGLKPN